MDQNRSEKPEYCRERIGRGASMDRVFTEMILFQVKPEKTEEFEALLETLRTEQEQCEGCVGVRYFKRFYTFDSTELGDPPRELTRVVKCVKYYVYWEYDTIEPCGRANKWLFDQYFKPTCKLLIMPFEINCGYSL